MTPISLINLFHLNWIELQIINWNPLIEKRPNLGNAGTQNDHPAQYRYPFIKPASSFSSLPSSAAWTNPAASYDYIIVGGGTAGCPLAATLSRNYSVLLLERGGTPFANSNVSFMQNFHITLADISEKSASQMFISTDGVFNARARVLGGGTCINAGFYTRASPRYNSPKILFYFIFFSYFSFGNVATII